MNIQEQIDNYINEQSAAKKNDLLDLHQLINHIIPDCKLWFDNGINNDNKVVCNPTIGYGFQILKYADGKTKDFFQIGISANATGISIYFIGLKDKNYLVQTFGQQLGKAKITGYCIKFKTLIDINLEILQAALQYGIAATKNN